MEERSPSILSLSRASFTSCHISQCSFKALSWQKYTQDAASHGKSQLQCDPVGSPQLSNSFRQLSKEDEAAIGQEVEVRREDQDKINKFSRLHQKELVLEEDLKSKNKEKEELEEVTTELELADEDDIVPYKIGDAFFHVSLEQAQDMLGLSTAKIEEGVEEVEEKLGTVREEMTQLKVELYARFGKSINLET